MLRKPPAENSSQDALPCQCSNVFIDVSRRTNWRSIEWNLFRRSRAIPTFGHPKRALIQLGDVQDGNRQTCKLCSLVIARLAANADKPRKQSLTVQLSYSKDVGLDYFMFIESFKPRKYDVHAQFHIYAVNGQ